MKRMSRIALAICLVSLSFCVIGCPPVPVDVPNVVGLLRSPAVAAITAAGLTVGTVNEAFSDTIPMGQVISQNPPAGTSVEPESAVNLILSKGSYLATVPDVVRLLRTSAESAIADARLVVGSLTEEYRSDVPIGQVIRQNPLAQTVVLPGSSVDLVLSKGALPTSVPYLVGKTEPEARATLATVGLVVGSVSQGFSDTVAAGSVAGQDPAAGTSVVDGAAVNLVISLGPEMVMTPNVVGLARADAQAALAAANLALGAVILQFSVTVPEGAVVSQNPAAGLEVTRGTAVGLVISKGPYVVPNVVGQASTAAQTAIANAGLTVGTTTLEYSNTVLSGIVVSQDPAAGVVAAPDAAVNLVVSKGSPPPTVPDVVGTPAGGAVTVITGAGYKMGTITQDFSDTVPVGSVISQNPAGGAFAAAGTIVNLVVSKGPRPVTVPSVVGLERAAAQTVIVDARLTVGTITQEYSATVAAGLVISQDPVSGASAVPGSPVNLVISNGRQPVPVPNVVGMTSAAAQTEITKAGFIAGVTSEAFSPTVPVGTVISQDPAAGTEHVPGSAIDLVVSKGGQPVPVPDVVGMVTAKAQTTIAAARLTVGTVTEDFSETVPIGVVMSQDPVGDSMAPEGSSVDLVVSKGTFVIVPLLINSDRTAAETAVANIGLAVGTVSQEYSSTIGVGLVCRQNPVGGTRVAPGSAVDFALSKGPEPVPVPNVLGKTRVEAQTMITAAGFAVGLPVVEMYSDTVAAGLVASQNPSAGALRVPGEAIFFAISKGPQPIPVPDIVGLLSVEAQAAIDTAGFAVGVITYEYSMTVDVGVVISQNPAAGTPALPDTAVSFVVSKGPRPVTVPNVVGMTTSAAQAQLVAVGLLVGTATEVYSDSVPFGTVITQDPVSGQSVLPGTRVNLVISKGRQPVTVPNVVNLPVEDARTAIVAANLVVGTVSEEFNSTVAIGRVVSQDPAGGSSVQPATAVKLVVSKGPSAVVPNLVGMPEADARTSISAALLATGTLTRVFDEIVAAGTVKSQDPAAGTTVARGSAVALVVSRGPLPKMVTVPDVTGIPVADAETIIADEGLAVGSLVDQSSETIPAGSVVSQTPSAGTTVAGGTSVHLRVSTGPSNATALGIAGVIEQYSVPYMLDFIFSLVDENYDTLTAAVGDLSVVAMEDGVPVSSSETAVVTGTKQFKCYLVLDYTNSMFNLIDNEDANENGLSDAVEAMELGAKAFIDSVTEDAQVGIYEFHRRDWDPAVKGFVAELSTDKDYLKSRIDVIRSAFIRGYPAESRCWDAINAAVQQLLAGTPIDEQPFIVVLSDGNDEASLCSPENIIAAAKGRHVQIFTIGYGGELKEAPLFQIAAGTGGQYFRADNVADLRVHFRDIVTDLSSRYALRWLTLKPTMTPPDPPDPAKPYKFFPSFTVSLGGLIASYTGSEYDVSLFPGDTLNGVLRVPRYRVHRGQNRATVYLRAAYLPRYINQFLLHVRAADDSYQFSVSKIGSGAGGLCATWPDPIRTPVAGGEDITFSSSDPSDIYTAIPYGSFGPLLRFDFFDLPSGAPDKLFAEFSVDDSVYFGGQKLQIDFEE